MPTVNETAHRNRDDSVSPHTPVVFEDAHLRVLDKPSGLSVLKDNTGAPSIQEIYPLRFGEPPLFVHRLDKGTSGLLIVARTQAARSRLSAFFKAGRVRKTYLALVRGKPDPASGLISLPLEKARKGKFRPSLPGKGFPGRTKYRTLETRDDLALVECEPLTGRTHQIRVHLAWLGCPLVKDPLYGMERGRPSERPHLTLHAWKLSFPHPAGEGDVDVLSPPPAWAGAWLVGRADGLGCG